MDVFGIDLGDSIAALFLTFSIGVTFGFIIGLMRFMMIGVFERSYD